NFAGHSDDDARMHQHLAAVRFLDEIVEHALGDLEVGDDAVLHGPDRDYISGSPPEHLFSFFADGFHFAGGLTDGDYGRLVYDNSLTLGVYQGVGGTKINGEIGRKNAEQRPQI